MHNAAPMWRNGRRNGLKIEVLAVPLLFVAHEFNRVFPGKLRELAIYQLARWIKQKGRHSCTNSCTRTRRRLSSAELLENALAAC
jgi:hypothetical protein